MPPEARPPAALILAAGQGTRMSSPLAKVLHPIGGRPMILHVVESARAAGARPIVVVVGHQAEAVRAVLGEGEDLRTALQAERRGTGHAVAVGLGALEGEGEGEVLILCGDVPLLRAQTLRGLLGRHRAAGAAVTVLTVVAADPAGYGRVVREGGAEGPLRAVVEEADATEAQRAIREISTGTYVFDRGFLARALPRLRAENRQGEYYLPDAIPLAAAEGRPVLAVRGADPDEAMGVNTPADLARAEQVFAARAAAGPGGPRPSPNLV